MNALCNIIAVLIKWTLIISVVIVGSFASYIAMGQAKWKKQAEQRAAHARDVIRQQQTEMFSLQLRYISGDEQSRYYLLGLVREAKVMMRAYNDWCPPVQKIPTKSTPDQMIEHLFDHIGNSETFMDMQGDKAISRAMLQINSCSYNDWPELIN